MAHLFTSCVLFEQLNQINGRVTLAPPLIVTHGTKIVVDPDGNRYVLGVLPGSGLIDLNPRGGVDFQNVTIGDLVLGPRASLLITRINADESYGWTTRVDGGRRGAIAFGRGRVYVAGDRALITRVLAVQALHAASGAADLGFTNDTLNPGVVLLFGTASLGGTAEAVALSPDESTLFIGGESQSGSDGVGFVAAIDAGSGAVRSGFGSGGELPLSGVVRALSAVGSRVYAFVTFDPARRDASLVAIDIATGAIDASFAGGRVTFASANGRATPVALSPSHDGSTIYAAGFFHGTDFGLGGTGTIDSRVDGIDAEDVDSFVIALDAQTGQPRSGFGLDTNGDGVGDGVAVFSDLRLSVCQALAAPHATASNILFLLANSPRIARNGLVSAEPDAFIARLDGLTGALEPAFGNNGIQSFGGSGTDRARDMAYGAGRLVVTGSTNSTDAGVGGNGSIGDLFSNATRGFAIELEPGMGAGLNAGPRIFSLQPEQATAGGAAFNLVVSGTRFTPQSIIYWNDSPRVTTFVNTSTLAVAISAEDLAAVGTAEITVFEPDGDEFDFNDVFSNAARFDIVGSGNAPVLTGLDPESRPLGGREFFLTVRGAGFENGALVLLDNQPRFTQVMAPDRVRATIPRADLTVSGSRIVAVTNPGSDPSNSLRLVIGSPVLDAIDPGSVTAGGPDLVLNVRGRAFTSASKVLFDSFEPVTTFINAGLLQALIPARLIDLPGEATVTVESPGSGRSVAARTFIITGPGAPPQITALAPSSANPGNTAFQVTIFGADFDIGADARWNDVVLTRVPEIPQGFVFQIPRTLIDQANQGDGTAQITVRNLNGQISNAVTFVVNPPTLQQLEPSSATAGGPEFVLTVGGTRFAVDAVVTWNGEQRPTTYISHTELTAMIPASDIAQAGTASVAVANPFGAISNAVDFQIAAAGRLSEVDSNRPTSRVVRLRDRNGDGVPDELERLLATSQGNRTLAPAALTTPLRIHAIEPMAASARRSRAAKGRLLVTGNLPVPPGFVPTKEPVYVYAGESVRAFSLNARGTSQRSAGNLLRVTLPSRRNPSAAVPFMLRLDSSAASGEVALLFNGTLYYLPGAR